MLVALTYPATKGLVGSTSGIQGVLATDNRWKVLVPVATAFLSGLGNMAVIGPVTTSILVQRKHQGTLFMHYSPEDLSHLC